MQSEAEQIAAKLTPLQRAAMIPLTFFSDKTGRELLDMGLFESDEGWPMSRLGGQVSRILTASLVAALQQGASK